jgi:hypothetical protein
MSNEQFNDRINDQRDETDAQSGLPPNQAPAGDPTGDPNSGNKNGNERGLPGGGKGRRDDVGRTGVYPVSAADGADPSAPIQGEMGWGQGDRGAEGYFDSGTDEPTPPGATGTTSDTTSGS